MYCKRCYRNGLEREGGPLGVCWKHQKTRCLTCGEPSAGEELCTRCVHEAEIERWRAYAQVRAFRPDEHDFIMGVRRERLREARHFAHEAIEVLFRGLLASLEALWGDLDAVKPAADPPPTDERKAA